MSYIALPGLHGSLEYLTFISGTERWRHLQLMEDRSQLIYRKEYFWSLTFLSLMEASFVDKYVPTKWMSSWEGWAAISRSVGGTFNPLRDCSYITMTVTVMWRLCHLSPPNIFVQISLGKLGKGLKMFSYEKLFAIQYRHQPTKWLAQSRGVWRRIHTSLQCY